MPEGFTEFALYISLAFGMGLAGGALPLARIPSKHFKGHVQHLAGGILLAVVIVELMPEARSADGLGSIVAGLIAGAIVMVSLKRFSRWMERRADGETSVAGLTVAAALDTGIDGLLIGAGFAADPRLGMVLALGLGVELSTLTLSVSSELRRLRWSAVTTGAIIVGISSMLVLGSFAGFLVLGDSPGPVRAFVLAFAVVALVYLVTEELLARGRKAHENTPTAATFFAGFIATIVFSIWSNG
jgi:zinc transporter, ZIP family